MASRSSPAKGSRESANGIPFELRESAIAGIGAFATRDIRRGTRIIEYTGERISNAEADRRYDEDTMANHHTFLFTLNRQTVVDAAVGGNEARFINHSCTPNCEAVIVDGKRIYIEALQDISAGAELVYDYQYERTDEHTAEDERFYACQCGAPGCRGTILAPKKQRKKRMKKAGSKAKSRAHRAGRGR